MRELTKVLLPPVCSSRLHLPGSLRSPGITRLHRYYGPSDSGQGQPPGPVSPLIPCPLPVVPAPTTPQPTDLQSWQFPYRDLFAASAAGFALTQQARPSDMPNRVHFRSGPTFRLQLLSTPPCGDAVTVGYPTTLRRRETDSHRSINAPSQAHWDSSRCDESGRVPAARLEDRGVCEVPSAERGRNGRSAAISTFIALDASALWTFAVLLHGKMF